MTRKSHLTGGSDDYPYALSAELIDACEKKSQAKAERSDGFIFDSTFLCTQGNRVVIEVNCKDDQAPFWPNALLKLSFTAKKSSHEAYASVLSCRRFERDCNWILIVEILQDATGCRRRSQRIEVGEHGITTVMKIRDSHAFAHLHDFSVQGASVIFKHVPNSTLKVGEVVSMTIIVGDVCAAVRAVVVRMENDFVALSFQQDLTSRSQVPNAQLEIIARILENSSRNKKAA